MSARTGLAIHRGTANVSDRARGVLILGVVSDEVDTTDELMPLVQKHDIEGLEMGG